MTEYSETFSNSLLVEYEELYRWMHTLDPSKCGVSWDDSSPKNKPMSLDELLFPNNATE